MEIERKFLVKNIPDNLEEYECLSIEQGYLSTGPVVRVRRSDNEYYLTYKGGGMMAREEYNLPLNEASYKHLVAKSDGNIISKKRYNIPLNKNLIAELDVFSGKFKGLVIVEVEFNSILSKKLKLLFHHHGLATMSHMKKNTTTVLCPNLWAMLRIYIL